MGSYVLDKGSSRFSVRAFASGMLASLGHNPNIAIRDFTGEASFDPTAPDHGSLRLDIRADSLEVTDDIKRKDRAEIEATMNQKVLESAKYPTITFDSRAVSANELGGGRYQVTLNGTLALRGATEVGLLQPVAVTGQSASSTEFGPGAKGCAGICPGITEPETTFTGSAICQAV